MKTLEDYEKEAEIQMGVRNKDGDYYPFASFLSTDVSTRMLMLAMRDFIEELAKQIK